MNRFMVFSYYFTISIVTLSGFFLLEFCQEIIFHNPEIDFASGTAAASENFYLTENQPSATIAEEAAGPNLLSFEEWLLLHKPRHSRQQEEGREGEGDNPSIKTFYYSSPQEFDIRKSVYEANLSRWSLLNQIPGGAKYGPELEAHADLTPSEFARLMGSCYREDENHHANRDETYRAGYSYNGDTEENQHRFLRSITTKTNTLATDSMNGSLGNEDKHRAPQQAFTIMDVDWRAHAPPENLQEDTTAGNSVDPISYVTPVKNQGPHGTCWSFAAAENLEGLAVRQGHLLQNVSEQEFISCCQDCQGRSADHTFGWLLDATNGVPALEESYPYVGNTSVPCLADTAPRAKVQLHSWGRVADKDGTGTAIVQALEDYGPMGLGVDAKCFHGYQSGIVRECKSGNSNSNSNSDTNAFRQEKQPQQPMINHAVLMVAAGTDLFYSYQHHQYSNHRLLFPDAVDFYVIKNSWGHGWGEGGYVRIERGQNWWGPIDVIYTE